MQIVEYCDIDSPLFEEIEVDESFFEPRKTRGNREGGASGKTIIFGLLKREGKVYTEIVPDAKNATLHAIICAKVDILISLIIQMNGEFIISWSIENMINSFVYIMQKMSLSVENQILMVLNLFDLILKLEELIQRTFICI